MVVNHNEVDITASFYRSLPAQFKQVINGEKFALVENGLGMTEWRKVNIKRSLAA